MPSYQSILLVAKSTIPEASKLAFEIAKWLLDKGICRDTNVIPAGSPSPLYDEARLSLIIVLGGDGTILGAARKVIGRKIPLVCINFGRVGFLSDIEPEQWKTGLEEVLSSPDVYRPISSLRWKVSRYGHLLGQGCAVNDVVLSRAALARLLYTDIYTDGDFMGAVRADGFLISTATGSSGYSVGAGGPLLHPSLNSMAFVPICPFLNTIPPMVFPCKTLFRFELKPGTTESYVTIDGQEGVALQARDVLEVYGVPDSVRLLGKGLSFIERLRTRSFILQDPIRNKKNAPHS